MTPPYLLSQRGSRLTAEEGFDLGARWQRRLRTQPGYSQSPHVIGVVDRTLEVNTGAKLDGEGRGKCIAGGGRVYGLNLAGL